ncbi:MAG: hypothetical protein V1933_08590 [Candidatus Omnitrophota bacterium]
MRIFKFILSILAIPFLISASRAFYYEIGRIYSLDHNQQFFILGAAVYLIVHTVLFKPNFMYIFGHEMTHALAAFISFGKVKSFKVSKKGGEVKTDKSNIFISLSPYFFPTYTLIIMLAWFLAGKFWQIGDWIYVFSFGVGFTLVFHFVMTVEFLKTKQPDLIKSGYLFSIALIYLINVTMAALILSFMFSDFSFKAYLENAYICGKEVYIWLFRQLFYL